MLNPYDHYRKVATETADPLELVIMLYRGAINYLTLAEAAIVRRDAEGAHLQFVRAQEIVAELMGTLNLDAGEVAVNLSRVYDYAQRRLIEANIRKDPAISQEVRGILVELLTAWCELKAQAAARSGHALAGVA
ncbi:MAG: flagellar export chaperone FliS [Thermomicrobiaceae bacterium]|nr:flagellar export chaperone FliS [Thermomicrobiaceae bacterium]